MFSTHGHLSHCQALTEKAKPCSYQAKHVYNDKHYCEVHFKKEKKNEECCVCYVSLQKGSLKLGCGHILHLNCLKQIGNELCPLCRAPFNEETKRRIVKQKLEDILINNSDNVPVTVLNTCFNLTKACVDSNNTELYDRISHLCKLHELNPQVLTQLLGIMIDYNSSMGTLYGFSINLS